MRFLNYIACLCNVVLLFLMLACLMCASYSSKVWGAVDLSQLLFFAHTNWWEGINNSAMRHFLWQCFIVPAILTLIILWSIHKFKKDISCYFPCFLVFLYALGIIFFAKYMLMGKDLLGLIVILAIAYFINLKRAYSAPHILGLLILSALATGQYICMQYKDLFVVKSFEYTDFYAKNYVKIPDLENFKRRNVILVFLESFNEDYKDYADEAEILHVEDSDAVKFSNFIEGYAQRWTQGALFSALTGTHIHYVSDYWRYKNSLRSDSLVNMYGYYLLDISNILGSYFDFDTPRIASVGKLAKQEGYQNLLIQGGSLDFSGTRLFLLHNGYEAENIYGYFELKELLKKEPVMVHDLMMSAFHDGDVFEVFKSKLMALSVSDKPFFATMFTYDMHFLQAENMEYFKTVQKDLIVNLNDFIKWFKKQPFYNNTTLIVIGDHNRMGQDVVTGQKIYNAFFNLPSELTENLNLNRTFNQIDMFPTILEIMGYKLPERSAGLGVSLFSDKKTLAENYSYKEQEDIFSRLDSFYYDLWQKTKATDVVTLLSKEKLIAHGGGVIDGVIYGNSLEAVEQSIKRGYKYIELDLLKTIGSSGFFAAHDYKRFKTFTNVADFKKETVLEAKILGKYTPLVDDDILRIFTQNPDIWLITDKIDDVKLLSEKLYPLKNRMIVEVSSLEKVDELLKNGFSHVAYTINSFKNLEEARKSGCEFAVVSTDFMQRYREDVQNLRWYFGKKVLLYALKNEAELSQFYTLADLFYYDGEEALVE